MTSTFKQIILLTALTCCFEGCTKQESKGNSLNESILIANEQKQDLGSLNKTKQKQASFSFTIKNPSEKTVNIESTDVSCECIHITQSPEKVESHDTATIKGYVDTEKQKGHISKSIFVKHEKDNVLLLRIVADIKE